MVFPISEMFIVLFLKVSQFKIINEWDIVSEDSKDTSVITAMSVTFHVCLVFFTIICSLQLELIIRFYKAHGDYFLNYIIFFFRIGDTKSEIKILSIGGGAGMNNTFLKFVFHSKHHAF